MGYRKTLVAAMRHRFPVADDDAQYGRKSCNFCLHGGGKLIVLFYTP